MVYFNLTNNDASDTHAFVHHSSIISLSGLSETSVPRNPCVDRHFWHDFMAIHWHLNPPEIFTEPPIISKLVRSPEILVIVVYLTNPIILVLVILGLCTKTFPIICDSGTPRHPALESLQLADLGIGSSGVALGGGGLAHFHQKLRVLTIQWFT